MPTHIRMRRRLELQQAQKWHLLFTWRSPLVDREPRPGGSGSALTKRSSRWRPVLGQRLSRFVDHHRKHWDIVMALLTVGYVLLSFFEDPRRFNVANAVV